MAGDAVVASEIKVPVGAEPLPGDAEVERSAAGPAVGIVGLGHFLPEGIMTAADLEAATGIPEAVVRVKLGLHQKHIAAPRETVSTLGVQAARRALADAGVGPEAVDAIIYFGSPHKDYHVWLAAPRIQHLLGASRAFCYEVCGVSAGLPFALESARGLFAVRPDVQRVLLVGASTESRILNYRNERSRFMFNFGDGAAAALLERSDGRARVLASAFYTDGRFAEFVRIPAGGALLPASHATVVNGLHFIDVCDPPKMKSLLDPITLPNFVRVGKEALARSGADRPDWLLPLHTKRSLFEALCEAFDLPAERGVYLEDTGHMSAVDPLLALARLADRADGPVKGERILILTAGTGYNWAATVLRWEMS